MKRQKIVPGSIIKVNFEDHLHTYGRLLIKPYVAFYDLQSTEEISNLQEIVSAPILFVVCVSDHAITKGRWKIIGHVPLDVDYIEVPLQFMQDSFPPFNCFLVDADGNQLPASKEDCRGLERLSVWEPEHVEERLSDFYAGRKNRWVESLKLKE